jgi:protein-S-isoprenylcysteine O-methyltransferase Ste14
MVKPMKKGLLKQASHEYSPNQRLIFLICLAPVFLLILPFLQVRLGAKLDQWLGLPSILNNPYNLIIGWLMILSGWLFAIWANYSQYTIGRGTPVPLMATQQLIVQPPYNYCRNPMALGAIVLYVGVGLLFHSLGAVLLALVFAIGLLIYIKRIEEKEMEIRFGQEYLEYKQRTPFLIPRFGKRRSRR